jgi:hypothetical protein
MKFEFSRQILKNFQKSNFMKIRSVGAELFRGNRRTDTTKLIVDFLNFAKAPKESHGHTHTHARTRRAHSEDVQ